MWRVLGLINLCLLLTISGVEAAPKRSSVFQQLEKKYIKLGSLIVAPLKNAPFPHSARDSGYTYKSEFYPFKGHYDDNTVVIFFPHHYRIIEDKVDLVFYFHGWHNRVDSVLAVFQLVEQFCQAKRNAILVIPQGPKLAPDSFFGKLEEPAGFKNLVDEILRMLLFVGLTESLVPGDIVLAGHSGGYRVIAYILLHGGYQANIKEVYLFDGLYAQIEKYAYWLDHQPGRFVNIFTDQGGTRQTSQDFMQDLRAWKIPFSELEEANLTDDLLKSQRILFIHSPLEHNTVVYQTQNFYRLLNTSRLRVAP